MRGKSEIGLKDGKKTQGFNNSAFQQLSFWIIFHKLLNATTGFVLLKQNSQTLLPSLNFIFAGKGLHYFSVVSSLRYERVFWNVLDAFRGKQTDYAVTTL